MNLDEPMLLRLENLTYTLPTADGSRTLLQDISLSVRRGEWLAIAGTNGSGKSTLIRAMAGLHKPTSGSVRLLVPESAEPLAGSTIPLVFQNPDTHLLGETVHEEVRFGLQYLGLSMEEMDSRAEEALRDTGLLHLAHRRVHSLSGGQKQLLAAAGCLALRPPLLLFDEATSMLDPLSRRELLETARRKHREGASVVWVTQLLDELACADRVAAMDGGRLTFCGTPTDFFYNKSEGDVTPCEQLGFKPPYAVGVAQELERKGHVLKQRPLTVEDLAEMVGSW
ncbi:MULTISPECIES: ATP-binding cassette domain-containing protein [Paenibacillus]|uniref:ATP-binding cassette domain-containing protein n=1 Tax=Paenibacillus TaxID=44249 RepID=UPI0022B8FC24|nr:ATP-binding cassette domain-containing protein [Paenibacillus caseinilyticus]MCZ8518521.1 ATP-binding cassette domain-containing protein [Paenibacillus caseinilyticus]